MALENAEEIRDVAADVVDDFDLRPPVAPQKDPAHADKRLDIGLVRNRADDFADPR